VFHTGPAKWQFVAAALVGGLCSLLILASLQTVGGLGQTMAATEPDLIGRLFFASHGPSPMETLTAVAAPKTPERIVSRSPHKRPSLLRRISRRLQSGGRRTGAEQRYCGADALSRIRKEVANAEIDENTRREAMIHIMATESLLKGASGLTADASSNYP
jgi:hypothetical protein